MSSLDKDDGKQAERRTEQGRRLEDLVRARWRGPGGIRGLAAVLGLTRATIYSWFRGVTRPNAAALVLLAKVLGVSPNELLSIFDDDAPVPGRGSRPLRARRRVSSDAGRLGLSPSPRLLGPADQLPLLESPTIVALLGDRPVASCEADEPVAVVARLLYANDFSQVPVRDRGTWIGLLTNESIARWLAARSARGLAYDEKAPVREILPYAEYPETFRVVAADARVGPVVRLFDRAAASGRPLAAVLLTETGEPRGELLAIVTPFDLPQLRRAAR
jgi:transcriptional regulator with XRE-family HTH domain/predicted transcriptional regulator